MTNKTNKPSINPEHPRMKSRAPERQDYRDYLAKTLQEKRHAGDKQSALKHLN